MKLSQTNFNIKRLLPGLVLAATLFAPVHHAIAQQATPADAGGRLSSPEAQSPEKNKQEADENDAYLHSPSVRKLGAIVGLNAEQAATAFTVANFIVLAALVGWFLLKTLPKTFRDRNTTIQKDLVDARTATEQASARLRSVEERLSKLDEQIAALRAQADKDSALDEQRRERGLTWVALAGELNCTPSRLTNLRTARLADMGLVMRVTQWLGRSAASFIHPAEW